MQTDAAAQAPDSITKGVSIEGKEGNTSSTGFSSTLGSLYVLHHLSLKFNLKPSLSSLLPLAKAQKNQKQSHEPLCTLHKPNLHKMVNNSGRNGIELVNKKRETRKN